MMVNENGDTSSPNSLTNSNIDSSTNGSINHSPLPSSSSSSPPLSSTKLEMIAWPYDEKDLYKVALQFYKDNEGKAFHPSYDQRNTLISYTLQEKHGQFNPEKAIPLGALDFVGSDRRNAWISLDDMSKSDARKHFVQLLDELCPFFRSYLIAVKFDMEEKERKRKELEEQEKIRQQEMERIKAEQEEKDKLEEKKRNFENQKRMIQEILNRQTINQFTAYAKQQYPDSLEMQEQLVKQLQEQHFQQYIQQMTENSSNEFFINNGIALDGDKDNEKSSLTKDISQLTLNNNSNNNGESCNSNNVEESNLQNHEVFDDDEDEESDDESNYYKHINNASMWTRKDIEVFKESVQNEGGHGIIKVGHGEIATIRVPTHDDGSCIFWEFATDYYDIGFGLFFEWNSSPDSQVSVYFSESEDDEDEEIQSDNLSTGHDIEKGTNRIATSGIGGAKGSRNDENHAAVSAIIPIYRRDCHEEVFAGSHNYPGKGVYLLKFDNSYSLWRSKTLYYRVYYTKEP